MKKLILSIITSTDVAARSAAAEVPGDLLTSSPRRSRRKDMRFGMFIAGDR